MQISEGELLGLVREVDDTHREAMTTFAKGAAMVSLAGAAVALSASAAQADDTDIAAFAASIELAAVAAYAKAAAALSGVVLTVAKTFASHHQDHANAWNSAAGAKAVKVPNARLLAALSPTLDAARTQTDVLTFALGLENRAASTYQFALENLTTAPAFELTASVMPIEGQHAVVIGTVLGKPAQELIPTNFQSRDGFIDPAQFPVS